MWRRCRGRARHGPAKMSIIGPATKGECDGRKESAVPGQRQAVRGHDRLRRQRENEAPGHLHAARLEGRLCRHDRAGADCRRQGLCRADGGHVRHRLRRQPKTREQVAAGMRAVHDDLDFTIACGGKSYDALLAEAEKLGVVDAAKKAAIGYCAGGGFALEQARSGADLKALVVSPVTNPTPVVPSTPCNIKGRVLAVHGSADPVTPKPMMDAFEEEMTKAKIDWQVMMFGVAVHSFCDPTANAGPSRYDEKLCRKAYMLMRDSFAETL